MIVAFRKHTLLGLDDCLCTLQETIPNLTRSSLYRCLRRNEINKLPDTTVEKKETSRKFKEYPIGYIHIDITQVRTMKGKLYLFVAIDRTCKLAHVKLYSKQTKATAVNFLEDLIATLPYKIAIIPTDNGIHTHRKQDKYAVRHPFGLLCRQHEIAHCLTKVGHPWTNGQVEGMNKTIKEATVSKYHYNTHEQLKGHLTHFLNVYNFAKRLTPFYQYTIKVEDGESLGYAARGFEVAILEMET